MGIAVILYNLIEEAWPWSNPHVHEHGTNTFFIEQFWDVNTFCFKEPKVPVGLWEEANRQQHTTIVSWQHTLIFISA